MGYAIKKVPNKKPPFWKLQFITYALGSATNKNAITPRKIKDVPKSEWHNHGFNLAMSYDEAISMRDMLNAQLEVKRWAETKVKIKERIDKNDVKESAFLPPLFVAEFEKEIIHQKMARGRTDTKLKNKLESHWRTTKAIIDQVAMDPTDWHDKAYRFYNVFVERCMSPSYVQKVLRILNQWGYFVSKKQSKAWLPIPAPSGADANAIANKFFETTRNGEGQESDPLPPDVLKAKKSGLKVEHYNWLLISVWFGLRPHEIDGLKESKTWKVSINTKGKKILWVYQPKLRTVPPRERWKLIPVIYSEQHSALAIIESAHQNFIRPIYKVMHNHFGPSITLYGGRKGFTGLMAKRGHSEGNISRWLGHMSLNRTYQDYTERLKVNYEDYDESG